MISFLLLVTIWVGNEEHKFRAYSSQRFSGSTACERSMDDLATNIRVRAERIKGGRARVEGACTTQLTRPT